MTIKLKLITTTKRKEFPDCHKKRSEKQELNTEREPEHSQKIFLLNKRKNK